MAFSFLGFVSTLATIKDVIGYKQRCNDHADIRLT